jgi:cell division protein FtsZ
MMGTGEASGEKRALRSAEAAISNPLIDDVSMKGARGLLVSITGGRDLTLYEVDEAATRIREEVDQEANIIVGATFDEGLEGIIRVSVVATGIDLVAPQAEATQPEVRAPESAPRTRAAAPAPRTIERVTKPETAAPTGRHAQAAADHYTERYDNERETTIEDVTIRPLAIKPTMLQEPADHAGAAEQPLPKSFIPPQAERPQTRGARMPRVEELPMPAQAEMRAQRGGGGEEGGVHKQRLSLLQRLASVGLGRRDDALEAPAEPRQPIRPAVPRPVERQAQPAPRAPEPRVPEPVSEYARRPAPVRQAPQGLDPHGRIAPAAAVEDDELEIPAFLRRQAN